MFCFCFFPLFFFLILLKSLKKVGGVLVIALHAGGRSSDCVVVLCDVGGRENFSDMVYNEINGNCKKYIVTTETKTKTKRIEKREGDNIKQAIVKLV